ncbi:putative GPI-anchor transamidase [Dictyocoela muelleri]|nr:putative GPI-anchor transamidase [Dictyocoela muelleri]
MIIFPIFSISFNTALLLNSSIGFHNYRHNTNIVLFYKILKNNGFKDEDIQFLTTENLINDERNNYIDNMRKGYVQIDNDRYIEFENIYNKVKDNLSKNKVKDNFSKNKVKDGLSKNKVKDNFSKNKANINNFLSSIHQLNGYNAIIYLCGHGGEYFLKFQNKECLFSYDLMRAVIQASRNLNKILLIIDTCHAESMIKKFYEKGYLKSIIENMKFGLDFINKWLYKCLNKKLYRYIIELENLVYFCIRDDFIIGNVPDNIFIICTSNSNEPSISSHYNDGPSLVDNFPFIFYNNFDPELTFKDFLKYFNYEELGSNLVFIGDGNVKLKEFFTQNEGKVVGFN